jgi:hypothetical protein
MLQTDQTRPWQRRLTGIGLDGAGNASGNAAAADHSAAASVVAVVVVDIPQEPQDQYHQHRQN